MTVLSKTSQFRKNAVSLTCKIIWSHQLRLLLFVIRSLTCKFKQHRASRINVEVLSNTCTHFISCWKLHASKRSRDTQNKQTNSKTTTKTPRTTNPGSTYSVRVNNHALAAISSTQICSFVYWVLLSLIKILNPTYMKQNWHYKKAITRFYS